MSMRRSDSSDRLHFRTERINIENGLYYFTTREGTQEGPFTKHDQAEVAVAAYIRDRQHPTRLASAGSHFSSHAHHLSDRCLLERRARDRRLRDRRIEERRQAVLTPP